MIRQLRRPMANVVDGLTTKARNWRPLAGRAYARLCGGSAPTGSRLRLGAFASLRHCGSAALGPTAPPRGTSRAPPTAYAVKFPELSQKPFRPVPHLALAPRRMALPRRTSAPTTPSERRRRSGVVTDPAPGKGQTTRSPGAVGCPGASISDDSWFSRALPDA